MRGDWCRSTARTIMLNEGLGEASSQWQVLKKPDRHGMGMDITEREWWILEDCWARYKRMTGLTYLEGVRDK